MTGEPSLLLELCGETLSSVVFVADYLQLDFNGPRLTCFVWPQVTSGDNTHSHDEPGYRDALCALIFDGLIDTTESPEQGLVLTFTRSSLTINPEPDELTGPEIAMLHLDDERWGIWRPGEGPFARPGW